MAKPLVDVETIYKHALDLLDHNGTEALSARNLAQAVGCSTRTLYQQVGKREELVARLVEYYFCSLQLEVERSSNWQQSATNWCETLRAAFLAHPGLSRLITPEHRGPIAGYTTQLLKLLLKAGFPEPLALDACRVLANVCISLTLSELVTPDDYQHRKRRSPEEIRFEDLVISRRGKVPDVFSNAVRWTIAGIENELAAS